MRFSLLIATLNRPKQLRLCVQKLLRQTYIDFEIIIIDQSDDNFSDGSIAQLDDRIQYYHITEKGLSHARNVGLEYVKGEYVCLVDDDGLYEESVLEKANMVISQHSPTILGGTLKDVMTGNMRGDKCEHVIQWRNALTYLCSATMIIERDFLSECRFDEDFGIGSKYGSGEESDVVLYALSQDKKVYYTNKYIVYHQVEGYELSKLPEGKLRKYAMGYGALCKKTFKKYSKFWGGYYYIKTVIGNVALILVCNMRGNSDEANARKIKAMYTVKGFKEYR